VRVTPERRRGFAAGLIAGVLVTLGVLAIVAAIAGWIGGGSSLTDEARQAIEQNYFEPVKGGALDNASVEGMIRALRHRYGDKFSHYLDPSALAELQSSTSGRFSGIGLTVNSTPKGLRVVGVLPGTPAEHAGLAKGDLITAVNGRSIAGLPSEVATARIKGPEGTEVTLRVRPAHTGAAKTIHVQRASVRIPAARGRMLHAGGEKVGYIAYATFSEGAHGELRDEADRLYRHGAKGLVLDLRGNGGGLLNEAVLSASIFLEHGLVVSTDSRTQGHQDYDATGGALRPRPMVVLIDHNTASAAEILASALEDHHLATIVGTRSYGKGTFQEVLNLDAGGALDLTIGRYLTADDISLAGTGIHPQVHAKDDPATPQDEALQRALAVLARKLAAK
jgi:carboxyl-terminal processing protease